MQKTFYPSEVVQHSSFPDLEIPWTSSPSNGLNFLLNKRWKTTRDLVHYSNDSCGDHRNKTYSLICTKFNITNSFDSINGILVSLSAQRQGRIVDEIIQLTYQGELIGVNRAGYTPDSEGHLKLTNETTYGSQSDLWQASITNETLQDPTFGILIKFQSHPFYPHKQRMYVDSLSLTIF